MKKKIILIIAGAIIILIGGFVVIKNSPPNSPQTFCQNKEFNIPVTLQSGEKGTIYLSDNHCELKPINGAPELSFQVLADGAIQNNTDLGRLYIWLRNSQLSIEQQIQSIISDQFNKTCQVEKGQYKQFDDLAVYSALGDNCELFGPLNEYSSEFFLATNNVIIAERHDGFDGLAPFNLASIKFIKD